MLGTVLLAVLFGSVPFSAALFCFNENGTIELSGNCTDIVAVFGTVHPFQTSFNISGSEIGNRKAVLQIGIGSWTKNLTIWLNSTTGKTSWTFDGKEAKSRDGGLPLTATLQFIALEKLNDTEQSSVARFSIKDAESQSRAALIKKSDGVQLLLSNGDERIERLPIWFRMLSDHRTMRINVLSKTDIIKICAKTENTLDCQAEDKVGANNFYAKGNPLGAETETTETIHSVVQKTWLENIIESPLYVVLFVVALMVILVCYSSSLCLFSVMAAGMASILTQDENTQMPRSQAISRSITRTFRFSRSRRSPMPPLPPLPTTTTSNLNAPTSTNDDLPTRPSVPKRRTSKCATAKSGKSQTSIRLPRSKSVRTAKPESTSSSTFPVELPLRTPASPVLNNEKLNAQQKAA